MFTLLQHCAVQTHAGSPFARFLRALFLLRLFLHCGALGTQAYKVVVRKAEHRPQHGGVGNFDVLLLGPQVRHLQRKVKATVGDSAPVAVNDAHADSRCPDARIP